MSKFIDESIRLLKAIDNYRARGAQDEEGSIEALHLNTDSNGSVVAEFYVSKPDDYTLTAYLEGNELHVENERGESVFNYADEHGWTEDDVNSMKNINEDYVEEEEGDPSVIRVIADLAVEPGYNDVAIANSVLDNISDFITKEFGNRVASLDLTYSYNDVQNDYDTDDIKRALGLTESYYNDYAEDIEWFFDWYDSLSGDEQEEVDCLADEMGLDIYDNCSASELSQLHDAHVSGGI